MQRLQSPRDVIPFQKPQDSIFSMLITRKISRVITFYLLRFFPGVTPNQVSVLSFVLCVIACLAVMQPAYSMNVVGAMLLQLSFAVDCSDGEVARIRNLGSKFGAWLDSVLDRFKEVMMFSALAVYAYQHTSYANAAIVLGSAAIIGMLMVAYIREAKKSSWPTMRSSEVFITKHIYIGTVDVTVYAVTFAVLTFTHLWILGMFAAVSIPLVVKQLRSAYRLRTQG